MIIVEARSGLLEALDEDLMVDDCDLFSPAVMTMFCSPVVQVMQFGRIDNNAYTLDFQYPYSAVQAFAVALANVTQRLK